MTTAQQADQKLVERVQKGDKRAFDLLVLKYQHKIMSLISRYVRDADEVQDVAQELLEQIAINFGWQTAPFPAVQLIEYWGTVTDDGYPNYLIVPDDEMKGSDGEYIPELKLFRFPERIWNPATKGRPEECETIAHEIAHYILKHKSPPTTKETHSKPMLRVVPEQDSEHQANWCMDELLVDCQQISDKDNVDSIMHRFNVTRTLATRRIRDFEQSKNRKKAG